MMVLLEEYLMMLAFDRSFSLQKEGLESKVLPSCRILNLMVLVQGRPSIDLLNVK